MNWLGKLLQKEIHKKDTVLDLGCGIFQAIEGIKCKSILGVEIVPQYIEKAKYIYPVVEIDISKNLIMFVNDSFDVVIALDVLEHLEDDIARRLIIEMQYIARKKVIIYTPSKFENNEQNVINTWGIYGTFQTQRHKSFIAPDLLTALEFDVSFPEPDKNTLAIWRKPK